MSSKVKALQSPGSNAPALQVVSFETADTFGPRYNQDTLIGRKGYAIYAQMLQDEQVKAVVQFKRDAILSPGWELQYDATSQLSEEEQGARVHTLTDIFHRMRGAFSDALAGICMGHVYGYSMTEKVYDQYTREDGVAVAGLNCLLPRPVDTFYFTVDAYGVLEKVEQHINGRVLEVDVNKFIHYVHNPQEDRFYGESDLRAAHRAWYAKGETMKLYLQYLARFAGGFAAIEQDADSALTPSSPDYQRLQSMLTNFRSVMGVILPKGVKLQLHSPATTTEYRDAMVLFDMQVAKSLLVPNLLGVSHTGETGSYAQSQTQLEAFFWTLQADTQRLEDCITEQLIADLCVRNWDDGEVPRFKFKPLSQETTKWVIDKWTALLTAGAVRGTTKDEERLRDLLDFPVREEEDAGDARDTTRLNNTEATLVAEICGKVSGGSIPHDSAKALLRASTALTEEAIDSIIDPLEVKPAPAPSSGLPNSSGETPESNDQAAGAGALPNEKLADMARARFHGDHDQSTHGRGHGGGGGEKPGGGRVGEPKAAIVEGAAAIKAMPTEQREDMAPGDMPGGIDAYNLYAGQKLAPKETGKLRAVSMGSNNYEASILGQNYDAVVNVGGRVYGVSKYEDIDAGDDNTDDNGNIKDYQYAYLPLDNPSGKMVESWTASTSELIEMIRAGKGGVDMSRTRQSAFSRAVSRVDFGVLSQRIGSVNEYTGPALARNMARAARRMLTDERMVELLDEDVEDIGTLRVDGSDVGRVKATAKEALSRAWVIGAQAAQRELSKATPDKAAMSAHFAALKDPVRDVAAGFFEANGFRMAANLTDGMRSIIQQELLNGVKSGARPPEVVAGIYDRLVRKGFTTLEALQLEESREDVLSRTIELLGDALDTANVPAYIDTLVRTNTFEALNEARFAEFTDPALEGFVQGLEYSAILDDRTTEICEHLDGRTYLSSSPVWDQYRPPNHYNCRSILIPVTAADGWDGTEDDEPTIDPQEGFGRGDK